MIATEKAKKYLDILLKYSDEVYRLALKKVPEGTIIISEDENGDTSINETVLEGIVNKLSNDDSDGKISMYEMVCISVYLSEKVFEINKILNENNIEEKIFENLLKNANDKKITLLLNNEVI